MIKKLAFSLLVLSFVSAGPALAETQTVDPGVCVQVYGGGVVCGASVPEHKPAPTGLGENLAAVGGAFILASGILLLARKRVKQSFAR